MKMTQVNSRLPRNFHKTFKPERQYINAMLRLAASGGKGDYQSIGKATGIPTGESSGKVSAILDYCRGMGLIILTGADRSSIKKPDLTPFGRIVLLEDPYLKSGLSQWIAHFNLCGVDNGADVWYHTFFRGLQPLGMKFERGSLQSYLEAVYQVSKSRLIGPMVGMYEDDAAFKICGALSEGPDCITRKSAPVSAEYACSYGAWLLELLENHFPEQNQISTTELDSAAGWRTIPGWDVSTHQRVLELIEREGFLEVDRHMNPWILRSKTTSEAAWRRMFDNML